MTLNLLPDPNEDLTLISERALAAGKVALSYFRGHFESWTKEQASPVTEVDLRLDTMLHDSLLRARPGYGWLSEERPDDGSRHAAPRLFIVDPLDGTRGFIRGDDTWCVSIGVVENHQAIAGVVYAPARNELLVAARGHGAFINGERLRQPVPREGSARRLTAPPAVHDALEATPIRYQRISGTASLAYRLGLVARGDIDIALTRPGSHDWDLAGAAALLAELGIEPVDARKGALRLNGAETRHGPLAVTADPSLRSASLALLGEVYGQGSDRT